MRERTTPFFLARETRTPGAEKEGASCRRHSGTSSYRLAEGDRQQQLDELRGRDPAARLHHAQLAVATDYGFTSWRVLKAHVDAQSIDGQIIAAARNGDARALDRLLAQHPRKITITGSDWNRPLLHIAAGNGHLDCVDVLLRHGFDIATRDRGDNATALHWAAQFGTVAVVERLLAAGADIDGAGDAHEVGALGWATCFRQVRREVADHLLARGARPTIFAAVALDRAELVRQLVTADPTLLRMRKMSRFEHHRTPLHLAVLKNKPAMVRLLLELGADAAAKDSRGYTPLNLATGNTDPAIVTALVAAGANPKERGTNRFEHVVPILNVKNVPASIAYYVDKLGFEKKWDWGSPPDFACVGRDQIESSCARADKALRAPGCRSSCRTSTRSTRTTSKTARSSAPRRPTLPGACAR